MSETEIDELLREANSLHDSPAKVAILEQAARLADVSRDVDRGFAIRQDLIRVAEYSGADEKMVAAFAWCISQYDADPERHGTYSIMWEYKWVVRAVTGFPNVLVDRIRELEDDIQRRYESLGYSLRVVFQIRALNAVEMGDLDRAMQYLDDWSKTPRDHMSDCEACEYQDRLRLMSAVKRDKECLAVAEPLLSRQKICRIVPEVTHGSVLMPMLRSGLTDEAQAAHRKGYRQVAGNGDFLVTIAEHLAYLTATGEFPRAVGVLERHLSLALSAPVGRTRFYFLAASHFLINSMINKPRSRKQRRFRLPSNLPVENDEGSYRLLDLAEYFLTAAQDLARHLDSRNGNGFHSQYLQELPSLYQPS